MDKKIKIGYIRKTTFGITWVNEETALSNMSKTGGTNDEYRRKDSN